MPTHPADISAQSQSEDDPPEEQLTAEEKVRYHRQMILPGFATDGQARLKATSVVIVGVGGLGSPAAAYLAGAGIGTIGLIDGDEVSTSNLHRQIIHSSHTTGTSKVGSAVRYLRGLVEGCEAGPWCAKADHWYRLNPLITYDTYNTFLTPENAIGLLRPYDLVLDCLDNPQSRYLLSDACITLCKPLVTASALGFEGQLMILNNPPMPAGHLNGGPCYRCIYPVPQRADQVQTCGEAGILGPVVGMMGTMMALEAIKVMFNHDEEDLRGGTSMLMFNALGYPPFRSIKLRGRQTTCKSCSATTAITIDSIARDPGSYDRFCGVESPNISILEPSERVSPDEYFALLQSQNSGEQQRIMTRTRKRATDELRSREGEACDGLFSDNPRTRSSSPERIHASQAPPTSKHILLDVRPSTHYALQSLPNSANIPYPDLHTILPGYQIPDNPRAGFNPYSVPGLGERMHPAGLSREVMAGIASDLPIYVICGNGNDSQRSVRRMKEKGMDFGEKRRIVDIEGGWAALNNRLG